MNPRRRKHQILADNGHRVNVIHRDRQSGDVPNDAFRLLARWLVDRHLAKNHQKSGNSEASTTQKILDFPTHKSAHVT